MEEGGSGSLASLRGRNRQRVVDTLRDLGVASRADIARHTGLSPTTVSSLISELEAEGKVAERDAAAVKGAGRPPSLIALDPSAGVAVGIDFGKTHVAVAAADLSHEILAESWRDMEEGYDAYTGVQAATELSEAVLDEAGFGWERVLGVGVGLPGPIHRPSETIGSSAILPGWAGVSAGEEFAARLGAPVHLDNDANLGALAELHWGAGRGVDTLAYLKVATGIGAGLVISGRLFRGVGGTAGEIGHTTIDEHGEICTCGRRGCLETVAAAPALVELLRRSLGEDLTTEALIDRATAGDPGCHRAIADAGSHIGSALADLCNIFNPARIVVGGTLSRAGDVLLDPIRAALERGAIPSTAEDVEIVPGVLGDRAELLGALGLVIYESDVAAVAAHEVAA